MIYLKICSDSKWDGIKGEHVIFTQAYLPSRQRRANYVFVAASTGQIWSWGQGGEADLKKCSYVWKNPGYAPDFPQCFCHCVSAVNIILYLIISCLIFNDANHL